VVCLGLLLRPFSLGHLLRLEREQCTLLAPETSEPSKHLPAAVLICCQSWSEAHSMRHDRLLSLKLWLWHFRVKRLSKRTRPSPSPSPVGRERAGVRAVSSYFEEELAKFRNYIKEGSLEFKPSDAPRADRSTPRLPGAPFILMLQQWLMTEFRLREPEAWDYPFGLAKMRWAAHWEQQGGLDLYNAADASFDAYIAREEAKGAELLEKQIK